MRRVDASANHPIVLRRLVHDSDAGIASYGHSCATANIRADGLPRPGIREFAVRLENTPILAIGNSAFLLVGTGRASIDLEPFGLPRCRLNVADPIVSAPRILDASGAEFAFSIPATMVGDVFFQWVFADPTASNAAGLALTFAQEIRIRP